MRMVHTQFHVRCIVDNFIFTFNLGDVSLCDDLIKYYENNTEYKKQGIAGTGVDESVKKSTDVTVYPDNANPVIQKYQEYVMKGFNAYCDIYKFYSSSIKLSAWNIQHYKPNEGFKEWHCERQSSANNNRSLVFMTYLNDINDEGGTEFYYQKFKLTPSKGFSAIFPADFTHTHRGIVSKTEHKYITTGWYEFIDVGALLNESSRLVQENEELRRRIDR